MKSAEAKGTCKEFNRCGELFQKMKQQSESLSLPDMKIYADLILFETDRVHIGGTEEEKTQILLWKKDLLMMPLKELCNQFNVDIDWEDWE